MFLQSSNTLLWRTTSPRQKNLEPRGLVNHYHSLTNSSKWTFKLKTALHQWLPRGLLYSTASVPPFPNCSLRSEQTSSVFETTLYKYRDRKLVLDFLVLPRGSYLCWRHEYGPSGVGFQKLSPQRGSHIAMVTPTIILTNDCASHILLQRWKHFTGNQLNLLFIPRLHLTFFSALSLLSHISGETTMRAYPHLKSTQFLLPVNNSR